MTNMPFVKLLAEMRGGQVEAQASEKLTEILEAINEYGGAGKLTLTFSFKTNKYGQVEVTGKVKSDKPERAIAPGFYWLDADAALVTRDPNQPDFEDLPGVSRIRGASADDAA